MQGRHAAASSRGQLRNPARREAGKNTMDVFTVLSAETNDQVEIPLVCFVSLAVCRRGWKEAGKGHL